MKKGTRHSQETKIEKIIESLRGRDVKEAKKKNE